MIEIIENKNLCSICKGRCCKKSGCDYFVSDFDKIEKEYLKKILDSGNVSIVSALNFNVDNRGKLFIVPLLYLRARNVDRNVIDLFSMKKRCSMLTDSGCKYSYEERPSGGKNLVPSKDIKTGEYNCYSSVNRIIEIQKWSNYQTVLSQLVKYYSGKSVNQKLKEDVEEVFYQLIVKDVDGVSKEELCDILSCLKNLIQCFPDEYLSAINRSNNKTKIYKK